MKVDKQKIKDEIEKLDLTIEQEAKAIVLWSFRGCPILENIHAGEEGSIPENISNAQTQGNLETIKTIIKNLNLTGNAQFLPTTNIRSEERIFIPLDSKNKKIPEIDDDFVFSTGLSQHAER